MAIRKVLVVDDSKTELMFMTDLLQKNGGKYADGGESRILRYASTVGVYDGYVDFDEDDGYDYEDYDPDDGEIPIEQRAD